MKLKSHGQKEVRVWINRISKTPKGVDYVESGKDAIPQEAQGRMLHFFASPSELYPTAIGLAAHGGKTTGCARECLYIQAQGEEVEIAFIAYAEQAAESEQIELANRIAQLMFADRAALVDVPDEYFRLLAQEMARKGLVLLRDGWCKDWEDRAAAACFEEVAKCLQSKQSDWMRNGTVQ